MDEGGRDAKLQFSLGGTIQLLVDGGVVAVECDVCSSRVGVSGKEDLDIRRDGKEESKLCKLAK